MSIYIIRNDVQEGPYPLEKINQLLSVKALKTFDLAWYEGLENWIMIKDIPGISLRDMKKPLPSVKMITELQTQQTTEHRSQSSPTSFQQTGSSTETSVEVSLKRSKQYLTRIPANKISTAEGQAILIRWGIQQVQIPKSDNNQKCVCPKCRSEIVQKISVLCEGGTSSYKANSSGVGTAFTGGHHFMPMVSRGSTSGVVKSALAQKFSFPVIEVPPCPLNPKDQGLLYRAIMAAIVYIRFFIIFWFISCLFYLLYDQSHYWTWSIEAPHYFYKIAIIPTLILTTPFFIYRVFLRDNNKVYLEKLERYNNYNNDRQLLHQQWNNSWYCHKCGYFGLLNA